MPNSQSVSVAKKFPKLDELNQFSPKLCRAMAVHDGKLRTQRELELLSGFSRTKILRLSKLDRWDGVEVGTMFRYLAACGFQIHRLRTDIYTRMLYMNNMRRTAWASQRRLLGRLLPS